MTQSCCFRGFCEILKYERVACSLRLFWCFFRLQACLAVQNILRQDCERSDGIHIGECRKTYLYLAGSPRAKLNFISIAEGRINFELPSLFRNENLRI